MDFFNLALSHGQFPRVKIDEIKADSLKGRGKVGKKRDALNFRDYIEINSTVKRFVLARID